MSWFDYVLLGIVAVATAWAIIKSVKNRKNCCSGDCSRCLGSCQNKK